MFKRKIRFNIFVAALLICAASIAAAAEIPKTTGYYVSDFASVMSSDAKAVTEAITEELEDKTTAQLVVVIVQTIGDAVLEEYSLELFRNWGIGQREENNGVLLLLAIDDRKSRIEVGYGLEGALPDGKTGRIQDELLIPNLKVENYDAAIYETCRALASVIAEEYGVTLENNGDYYYDGSRSNTEKKAEDDSDFWFTLLGLAVLVLLDVFFNRARLTMFIIGAIFSNSSGGGRGSGRGGSGGGGYRGRGGSGGGGGSSRSW